MGLNITPDYKITANDNDITATIRERFKSLSLADETGTTSDTFEVNLADHLPDAPIAIPKAGAELRVSLGYDGVLVDKGLYIVDEIEMSGEPRTMTIRARAAPYEASTGGKQDLQTQKTRSWKAGTTIGAMVSKMASEHGLKASVSATLAKIALPVTHQSAESDMNLLNRLGKRYDAVAKPAGGTLLFTEKGDSKTSSGADMPRFIITPADVSKWRVTIAKRDSAGTVVAFWHDKGKAARKQVQVGSGDPVVHIRTPFTDEASALAAAKAKQRERARGEVRVNVTMVGNPTTTAESVMVMDGFRDGVDGEWNVTHAEHYIGPDGYRNHIEAEKPNADKDVSGSTSSVSDGDQNPDEI